MAKLKIKDCVESRFIDSVMGILKKDPDLSRIVKHWDFWDGRNSANNVNQLPMIGVYPEQEGDAEKAGYNISDNKFVVIIEVTVDGSDCRDVMNMWHLVRMALNDDAIKALNRAVPSDDGCYVNSAVLKKPGYGPGEINKSKCMVAQGKIEADIFVRTQKLV